MPSEDNHHEIVAILALFAKYDMHGSLFWRCEGGTVRFAVHCNDLFHWATSDAEEINLDRLPILQEAIDNCVAVDPEMGDIYGVDLYCCRCRGMRPQGAAYPRNNPRNKDLWRLFDAAGPEREITNLNPYRPGERAHSMRKPRPGFRYFRCDCGREWIAASRDCESPSGEECWCGLWVQATPATTEQYDRLASQ